MKNYFRPFQSIRALMTLGSVMAIAVAQLSAAQERPNFLIILADDLTFDDVGVYGGVNVPTPNIDLLAKDGLKMDGFFSPAPTCAPMRHALYNGLFPVRSGAHPNHSLSHPGTRSLPHFLNPLGYRTALVGKRHIRPEENYPFEYLDDWPQRDRPDTDQALVREFINRDRGQPWCLVIASHEPHTPWVKGDPDAIDPDQLVLPPYLVDTPEMRAAMVQYYAEVIHLDNQVGQFLAILDEAGMTDNTLVMFFSEQGASVPFAKWSLYEAGIRVAANLRWPGIIQPGSTTSALVQYIDVPPTLVELAGGTPPAAPEEIDGFSFARVLVDTDREHRNYIYSVNTSRGIIAGPEAFGNRAVRDQRYKLIWNTHPENTFSCTMNRTAYFRSWERAAAAGDAFARQQVEAYLRRPEWEFYDLARDPHEMDNLIDDPEYTHHINRLKVKLGMWMAQQGDKGRETEMDALERMPPNVVRRFLRGLDSD